jgi:long-chain acyl-CoA synthetase
MTATVLDALRRHAAQRPDHPALIVARRDGGTRVVRYAALLERTDAIAAGLRADGVEEGDRCGLVAPQGAGFIEHALGILAAGGCLVPIPDDHKGEVLEEFSRRAHLHHLRVLASGADDGAIAEPVPVAAPAPVDGEGDLAFRALQPAYLRFTSGTTHRRKGVILGHRAILERLDAANRALGVAADDRILWLLPMAHHFVVSILLYLRAAATILLPASPLARDVLALAEREGATVLYGSPYHFNLLSKDGGDARLGRVRLAISTAEGLRPEIAAAFRERFGFPLRQALGIIEVGLPVLDLGEGSQPGALGRPLPDYEVWLRGEDGRPVAKPDAPERSGEICIRGPGLFDAYMEPWTPGARVLEPDGFRTGDQGWIDADGNLHLAGRRANRINMAGMKFFAEEVEAVLEEHPGVRRSRVFGREHAHLGEIPVAEIEATDPDTVPDRKALQAFCRARLPAYKIPREFRPVAALPLTPTGKLERTPGFDGRR